MQETPFLELLSRFKQPEGPSLHWDRLKTFNVSAFPPTYKLRDLCTYLEKLEKDCLAHELRVQKNHSVIFVDGVYRKELSSSFEGVEVLTFSEAKKPFGPFFSQYNSKLAEEKDFFSVLNSALMQEGVFVYIPPNKQLQDPLLITHILTGAKIAAPRIVVYAGKNASAQMFLSHQVQGACFNNEHVDCFLDEGAQLDFCAVDEGNKENWQFRVVRAQLKKESRFLGISFGAKTKVLRNSFKATLRGANSSASFYNGWTLFGRESAHVEGTIEHLEPGCHSMQSFKGILNDQSRSSIEGQIYVHPIAQKTEAYQKIQHLLLDERAIAINKPALQILADDVKASHGATVGRLCQEELFYLKSRGLCEKEAKELLVLAFSKDLISKFPIESARIAAEKLASLGRYERD